MPDPKKQLVVALVGAVAGYGNVIPITNANAPKAGALRALASNLQQLAGLASSLYQTAAQAAADPQSSAAVEAVFGVAPGGGADLAGLLNDAQAALNAPAIQALCTRVA